MLLKLDNTYVVVYITTWEAQSVRSSSQEPLELVLGKNIHIIAQHLPGVLNLKAVAESRTMQGCMDWKLNLVSFRRIEYLLGSTEVDQFTSTIIKQSPIY